MSKVLGVCSFYVFLSVMLSACANNFWPPVKIYEDSSIPLSQTAVISINPNRDANLTGGAASIEAFNGVHPPCEMPNCPIWFRVPPGSYDVELLQKDFSAKYIIPVPGAIQTGVEERQGVFNLHVDAEAGHTYYLTQKKKGEGIIYIVEDVGLNMDPETNRQ